MSLCVCVDGDIGSGLWRGGVGVGELVVYLLVLKFRGTNGMCICQVECVCVLR